MKCPKCGKDHGNRRHFFCDCGSMECGHGWRTGGETHNTCDECVATLRAENEAMCRTTEQLAANVNDGLAEIKRLKALADQRSLLNPVHMAVRQERDDLKVRNERLTVGIQLALAEAAPYHTCLQVGPDLPQCIACRVVRPMTAALKTPEVKK